MTCHGQLRDDYIPHIFFNLPSSIQVFTIRPQLVVLTKERVTEESFYRRDEPLFKLKEWDLVLQLEVDVGYLTGEMLSPRRTPFSLPSNRIQLVSMEFGALWRISASKKIFGPGSKGCPSVSYSP